MVDSSTVSGPYPPLDDFEDLSDLAPASTTQAHQELSDRLSILNGKLASLALLRSTDRRMDRIPDLKKEIDSIHVRLALLQSCLVPPSVLRHPGDSVADHEGHQNPPKHTSQD